MSILLTHQNSLAFGMLHVVQNTFNTKLIRYDLNSIIRPQNKIKNKNLNHNHIENKKKSSKTRITNFVFLKKG